MKYLVLALLLSSCASIPLSLRRYDTDGFSHDGNTFYYHNKPIAKLQAVTFSLDGSKLVKEINLKVIDPQEMNKIPNLIKYIYKSHKTSEVEVEVAMENN